jgi:hypothetical protein
MLTQRLPVRMQATKNGTATLIVEAPRHREPAHFSAMRAKFGAADRLAGQC